MHIVFVVPTDRPDALVGFLAPLLTGRFVLDAESFDRQTSIIHGADKVERYRRSCFNEIKQTFQLEPNVLRLSITLGRG